MLGDLCTAPRIISLSPLSLATDLTDATLGASGLLLGTRTGAGGLATLTESFFDRSPWFHDQQVMCFTANLFHSQSANTVIMGVCVNEDDAVTGRLA
jgi:hypothetical protein